MHEEIFPLLWKLRFSNQNLLSQRLSKIKDFIRAYIQKFPYMLRKGNLETLDDAFDKSHRKNNDHRPNNGNSKNDHSPRDHRGWKTDQNMHDMEDEDIQSDA